MRPCASWPKWRRFAPPEMTALAEMQLGILDLVVAARENATAAELRARVQALQAWSVARWGESHERTRALTTQLEALLAQLAHAAQ